MPEVQKATIHTSQETVYCDVFDAKLTVAMHRTEAGEAKVLLTIEKGKDTIELSLYYFEVMAVLLKLLSFLPFCTKRPAV